MLAVGELLAVIVPGVTVEPVTELLLQHKSLVLVTLVSGSVGDLNDDVYNAVPLTTRKLEIQPAIAFAPVAPEPIRSVLFVKSVEVV